MEIGERLRKMQEEGLKREGFIPGIIENIRIYNSISDEFQTRNSLLLSNVILKDIQEFLRNSDLQYSQPVGHRFVIDSTGIELQLSDEGFTLVKEVQKLNMTIIAEFKQQLQNRAFQNIPIHDIHDIFHSENDEELKKFLEKQNLTYLQELSQELQKEINNIETLLKSLINGSSHLRDYEYFEYGNEEKRYKTIEDVLSNNL